MVIINCTKFISGLYVERTERDETPCFFWLLTIAKYIFPKLKSTNVKKSNYVNNMLLCLFIASFFSVCTVFQNKLTAFLLYYAYSIYNCLNFFVNIFKFDMNCSCSTGRILYSISSNQQLNSTFFLFHYVVFPLILPTFNKLSRMLHQWEFWSCFYVDFHFYIQSIHTFLQIIFLVSIHMVRLLYYAFYWI